MKRPKIVPLDKPALLARALQLEPSGRIAISSNELVYLKIDDDWIHALYPYLHHETLKKPDYFANEGIGAHISVIYPEENKIIGPQELGQIHYFKFKAVIKVALGIKYYYVLTIEAPSLTALRRAYDLPNLLNFKGYAINLHITLATELR